MSYANTKQIHEFQKFLIDNEMVAWQYMSQAWLLE
jgi:hypothetical protein